MPWFSHQGNVVHFTRPCFRLLSRRSLQFAKKVAEPHSTTHEISKGILLPDFCFYTFKKFKLFYYLELFFSRLHSFPNSPKGFSSARFNSSGTRLLCGGSGYQLTVYDLPTRQQPKTSEFIVNQRPLIADVFCFSGLDDELVISVSPDDKRNLSIWSLPIPGQDILDCPASTKPLCTLTGHEEVHGIQCVRYSRDQSAIISCDASNTKLWTLRNN